MLDENEGLWKGLVIIVQIADILYCIEVRRSWERDWFCSKNSAPYALLPVVADGASHWLVFVSLENDVLRAVFSRLARTLMELFILEFVSFCVLSYLV